MNWSLDDTRNNFSKVVKLAQTEGPRTITVRAERAAAVLSATEYDRLTGKKLSFAEFLLSLPRIGNETAGAINCRSKDFEPPTDFRYRSAEALTLPERGGVSLHRRWVKDGMRVRTAIFRSLRRAVHGSGDGFGCHIADLLDGTGRWI
jgi:prevent-host-death family protein